MKELCLNRPVSRRGPAWDSHIFYCDFGQSSQSFSDPCLCLFLTYYCMYAILDNPPTSFDRIHVESNRINPPFLPRHLTVQKPVRAKSSRVFDRAFCWHGQVLPFHALPFYYTCLHSNIVLSLLWFHLTFMHVYLSLTLLHLLSLMHVYIPALYGHFSSFI